MKPIINPWIFYLVKVSESIIEIVVIVLLALVFAAVAFLIKYACLLYEDCSNEDEEVKAVKGILKKLVISMVVFSAAYIFIPSRETYYQMIISSQVTTENVQNVEDVIKESVDYIIEKMNDN